MRYTTDKTTLALSVALLCVTLASLMLNAVMVMTCMSYAAEAPKPSTGAAMALVEVLPAEESEDPDEAEKIDEALLEQGYYREDVPLDFELQDTLRTACEANGIPYEVGLGLIEVESNFRTGAVSPAGCYGLCQLNPRYFPADLNEGDNIRAGMGYLGHQLERYGGDLDAALTAYNAGHDTGKRTYANEVLAAAQRWAGEEEFT